MATLLKGFSLGEFRYEDTCWPLYRGGSGPGVVIMHEVPGITPQVAEFARCVAARGFTVFMPSLFGTPGEGYGPLNIGEQLARACVGREFSLLARHQSSPITEALRALCRQVHEELGGPGVGAIGMCLTGNFALALMLEPAVIAPVLSQPSLPLGITPSHRAALHVSAEELAAAKRRVAEGHSVLGLRFTHDLLCPAARFETLREELGSGFEAVEIDSGPLNPHGIPLIAHSVLAKDLVDEAGHPSRLALMRVLDFFTERLLTQAAD